MAFPLFLRAAVWCVANQYCRRAETAAALYVLSGGVTDTGTIKSGVENIIRRWMDGEDTEALEEEFNVGFPEDPNNPGWVLADVEDAFELRKLQVRWSRAPAGGTTEDVDVCTFHFLKLASGVPTNSWVTGDYTTLESAFGTFWGSIKVNWASWIHLDQYRWYADGPDFYHLETGDTIYKPNGDNPARRVTEVDVAGTLTGGTSMLPPQVAMTVTEKTSSRKHWGRFFLPGMSATNTSADGRISSSSLSSLLSAAVTFYNAARAASLIPVVFSIQKPVRPKKPSGTLPAVGAVAYEISSLQMDDLFDVIRSRRYGAATIKTNTALT